jgi:nucleotide-binding universal stress UspA family protein
MLESSLQEQNILHMQTLLIATDFSAASHNALLYGVGLAEYLNAKIVLFHAWQSFVPTADVPEIVPDETLRQSSEENLVEEVQSLTTAGGVSIETLAKEGSPADAIVWAARDVKANWIMAGMKGSGKTVRKIFGSTATSLTRHSTIPLIVVPENARFKAPEAIALASDIDEQTDLRILDPLQELGLKFNSNMYVLRVIEKGMNEVFEMLLHPGMLKWYLKKLHPSFRFLNDNNTGHAINEFVKKHNVDVVAMIAQEHNIFERIFLKSHIKEMMFQTDIPLIILPGRVDASKASELVKTAEEKE